MCCACRCLLAARGPLRLSQSRIVHRRRGTTVAAGVTRESFGSRVPKPAFYEGLDRPIGAPGSELHPSFALLIFGIVSLGHLHPDSFTLFKVSTATGSCVRRADHSSSHVPGNTAAYYTQANPPHFVAGRRLLQYFRSCTRRRQFSSMMPVLTRWTCCLPVSNMQRSSSIFLALLPCGSCSRAKIDLLRFCSM